jgi:RNA polymerase primary sigma factor
MMHNNFLWTRMMRGRTSGALPPRQSCGRGLGRGPAPMRESPKPAVALAAEAERVAGSHPVPRARYDADSAMRLYLREIGQVRLLTPEEEVTLAARIRKGDKAAREQMIKANLRLVVKIARDYEGLGLPLLDLISEGNIGLMKAVERFDPAKGGKLSTYAAWWIKQSIKRGLANQSKTIRLPVHMVDKISKMRRVAMTMSEELGREPTDDELSEEIGIDRAKLSQLKAASLRPASLDAPISDDDSTEFGEIVGDENASTPFELLSHKNMHGQLDGLLEVLDSRERKIIDARFGLMGQKPKTLEEVGQEFGVTRERIRQLQNIALKKLRRALAKKEDPGPRPLKGNGKKGDGDDEEDEDDLGEGVDAETEEAVTA